MTENLIDVCDLEDLQEGKAFPVRVGGRNLVLVRWEENVFALRDICPHMSRALEGGNVVPGIWPGERLGDLVVRADRPVIKCPWHGWMYDLTNGRCPGDEEVRVATYQTRVLDNRVLVDLSRRAHST